MGPSWAQFRKALRDAAATCWHLGAVPLSLSQSPISRAVPTGCSSQRGSPPGSASSCITGREGASGAEQRIELQGRGWEAEQREGPPLRSMELRAPQTGRVASSVRLSSWQEFKENQRIPGRDRGTPTPDCPAVGHKVKDPGGREHSPAGKEPSVAPLGVGTSPSLLLLTCPPPFPHQGMKPLSTVFSVTSNAPSILSP